MPLIESNYKPKGWLKYGHLQTIYSSFFRKINFSYDERQRITLSDGDFLDLDWKRNDNDKLVVLCHGLEGSSSSTYILGMAKHLNDNGFDILAINYRSCSGEMNINMRFYHHGATDDLNEVMPHCADYRNIHLMGFSLGGNLALKYVGEDIFEKPKNLKSVTAFSVPIDLEDCVQEIHKVKNQIYVQNFLITLKKKVKEKAEDLPELKTEHLKKIKSLVDFDNHYTAPIHGFKDAYDYYQKVSSKRFLKNIKIPALIVNAADDPMLGNFCYPTEVAKKSNNLYFMHTQNGGHCGFIEKDEEIYFSERTALWFIQEKIKSAQLE